MKLFGTLILLLGFNISFAQKINYGGYIDYTVTIISEGKDTYCTSIRNQLNSYGRMKWMYLLNKSLYSGKTTAYRYQPELNYNHIFDSPLGEQELKDLMVLIDTISTIDGIIPIHINKLDFDLVTKIRFIEIWSISKSTTIEKEIVAFAPVFKKYSEWGEYLGEEILFWLKPDAIIGMNKEIVITEWIENRVTLSDTIPTLPNTSWIIHLIEKVKDRKMEVYPSDLSIYDEFEQNTPITSKDIYNIFNAVDTVFVPDSINPEILIPHTFPHSEWISKPRYIDFREKWILHSEKGLTKEVLFYAPVFEEMYQKWGLYKSLRRLFWMK